VDEEQLPDVTEPAVDMAALLNCIVLDELLDLAIDWIPQITAAQVVSIFIVDDARRKLVMMRHSKRKGFDVEIDLDDPGTLILEVFRKKKAILIHDIPAYAQENKLPIEMRGGGKSYGSSSCMLVPIAFRPLEGERQIIGALNLTDKANFEPFTKEELRYASQIGETLGTAVHNTRIIERKLGGQQKELLGELAGARSSVATTREAAQGVEAELEEAARRVQQLLPELPKIPGYELAVHYRPMAGVGGDFYDFIPIDEHRIGIAIGDVAGHGIEAALVMSMTKQVLNLYSKIHGTATEALIRANGEIFDALKGQSFISVFFGILDTRTHVFSYARAGHNPPFLHNPARNPPTIKLDAKGMVLGTTGSRRFGEMLEEIRIPLRTGDLLLLYTDGVVEAMTAEGEEFGEERLVLSLEANAVCTPDQLKSRLARHVSGFSAEVSDDQTILVIKAIDIVATASEAEAAEPAEALLMVDQWLHEGELAAEAAQEVFFQAEPVDVGTGGLALSDDDAALIQTLADELGLIGPLGRILGRLGKELADECAELEARKAALERQVAALALVRTLPDQLARGDIEELAAAGRALALALGPE